MFSNCTANLLIYSEQDLDSLLRRMDFEVSKEDIEEIYAYLLKESREVERLEKDQDFFSWLATAYASRFE